MTSKPVFDEALEYETLRQELSESRKYVFERPLLIITLSIAAFNILDEPFLAILPAGFAALSLFNFWFTSNRLRSMSRIIAYIQLQLEGHYYGSWIGWETSLRFYRIWQKKNLSRISQIIKDQKEENAVPDALMYYPPIYDLHICMMILSVVGSVTLIVRNFNMWTFISGIVTFVIISIFFIYACKLAPGKMRSLIEDHRVIWKNVFDDMRQVE